ncbi:MAG TPA: glycosyltransferase [Solirubrobacteraceae bacterium]|nr:glycosyltransferase [Solirubrobacteraceae bacterium]
MAALVLSVDEAHRLDACLPPLAAAEEVVVVDNACTDDTTAVAARLGARVVRLDERRSYAAAMNAGLAAVRDADAVLLVNADCVLEPGALPALTAALASDERLGAVAPKLVRAADPARIDAAGMLLDRRRKNNVVGHNEPDGAYGRPAAVFGPDGACGLWRRAALDDCAPDGEVFDEDLALWASDADLAWRARLLGWRALYEPAARGTHVRFFSPTTRARVEPHHRRLQFRNRLLMIAKNDRPADLLRDLPGVALYEVLALAYALVVERELLGGYADAARALPGALRRRRAIQPRRRATPPFGLVPPR